MVARKCDADLLLSYSILPQNQNTSLWEVQQSLAHNGNGSNKLWCLILLLVDMHEVKILKNEAWKQSIEQNPKNLHHLWIHRTTNIKWMQNNPASLSASEKSTKVRKLIESNLMSPNFSTYTISGAEKYKKEKRRKILPPCSLLFPKYLTIKWYDLWKTENSTPLSPLLH